MVFLLVPNRSLIALEGNPTCSRPCFVAPWIERDCFARLLAKSDPRKVSLCVDTPLMTLVRRCPSDRHMPGATLLRALHEDAQRRAAENIEDILPLSDLDQINQDGMSALQLAVGERGKAAVAYSIRRRLAEREAREIEASTAAVARSARSRRL